MEGVSEGLWSCREEERGAAMKNKKNACYQVPGSGSAVRGKQQLAEKASGEPSFPYSGGGQPAVLCPKQLFW